MSAPPSDLWKTKERMLALVSRREAFAVFSRIRQVDRQERFASEPHHQVSLSSPATCRRLVVQLDLSLSRQDHYHGHVLSLTCSSTFPTSPFTPPGDFCLSVIRIFCMGWLASRLLRSLLLTHRCRLTSPAFFGDPSSSMAQLVQKFTVSLVVLLPLLDS